MRVTKQVVEVELLIGDFLSKARWVTWHVEGSKRSPAKPTLVALHPPDGLVIAVYARPRRLAPSELPDVSWLPPDWLPCVWHPALSKAARAWLAAPIGDPPGAVLTTRDGAK